MESIEKFQTLLSEEDSTTYAGLPPVLKAQLAEDITDRSVIHFEASRRDYEMNGWAHYEINVYIETDNHLYSVRYSSFFNETQAREVVLKAMVRYFMCQSEGYRKEIGDFAKGFDDALRRDVR
ncbi:hypothetical protein [Priestia taiwanensis]|uniref:Uncharacterized protein n=1 Tax=Priestia taiwanensis TaxID=1347902 RepID=A0A917AWV1_9BACI|nr:hypothetical protein [Priestia taiwanensis]MBM7364577.1 hypothetical protein [Priestia taiwanensis]GGE80402.1 hypothetical protein GCM10007140_32410 [Priestia taiwanensis]